LPESERSRSLSALAADEEPTRSAALFLELEQLARTLEPGLRARLVDEWTLAARFEHASIASFNKFSLELLALGAPAALVAASNLAALQEVEHARASFALASSYAGRGIGPGPLAIDGLWQTQVELLSATLAAVREGCVEETLAAAEASFAERRATVPAVRWVLARVAREEREHAALAFRFVRWACDTGGSAVRSAAQQAFIEALAICRAEPAPSGAASQDVDLEPHGRLAPSSRAAGRQSAIEELLEPAYRDLFG
jgi:hypothetical protein